MKRLLYNRIQLIFTTLLFLFSFSYSYADIIRTVTGKAYLLAIGINDYASFRLKYCESDAIHFVERVKNDSSLTEIQALILLGKMATKDSIREALIGISKLATSEDLFIFFNASAGIGGSILLSDSSAISSIELYAWSQSILTTKQLFYLDICDGDKFVCQLKKHIMQNPDVSALCKQNRVILSVAGRALESEEVQGGLLTGSYVRNSSVEISDLFSESNRTKTELLYNLYTYNGLLKDIGKKVWQLEIEYFSEKEFYNFMVEKDTNRGTSVISSHNGSLDNEFLIKKGETLCLIIGIIDYDFINPLNNTLNDAREIKSILSENYNTKIIYLENPTYDEFELKLAEIQNEYKFEDGSQFLFFTAAHGSKNELGQGCLLLKDCKKDKGIMKNAIPLINLKRFIGQLSCTNSIILLDICHSGTMLDDETCVKPAALEIPKTNKIYNEKLSLNSIAYKNFLNQKTKIFIGSSNDQEAADGTGIHSPFAAVLLNFLKENALPVIDSYYLQKSIEKNIMTEEAISIPQFCMYGGCKDDGRFLFIRK